MWQEVIVAIIVLCAVLFVARYVWQKLYGSACGGCGNCPATNLAPAVNRFITPLLWLLSLLGMMTAGMFLYQVTHYSNNAPMGDDIDLIVANTIAVINAHSFSDWLSHLMTQNAEHRPAMLPLMGLLSYAMYGQISLSFINVMSAALLLASLFTILYSVTPSRIEIFWMAAWALPLAAAPLHYECVAWASCSASHYTVIAFSCLAIFFATRTGWLSFLAFEILSILALLSLFSGLLTLVLGALAIYIRSEPVIQKRQFLCVHIGLAVLMLGLYMINLDLIYKYLPLEKAHISADPLGTLQQASIWFFAWLGAWLDFEINLVNQGWTLKPIATPWAAISIGVCELVIMLLLVCRYWRVLLIKHLYLTLTATYLLCTISVAAFQRSLMLALPYIYTSRYQLYTVFLVISVLALIFALLRENGQYSSRSKTLMALLSIASLLFYVRAYNHFGHYLVDGFALRERCIREWNAQGIAADCWWKGDWKVVLDKSVSTQLFRIEH